MRIHDRGAGEDLQRTIPRRTAAGSPSGVDTSRSDALAPRDTVQISSLNGVLNSFQIDAKANAAKVDRVSRLVQQNRYQVDAIVLSRTLIAAAL